MDVDRTAAYRALISVSEHSIDGVAVIDSTSHIRFLNPAGKTMLGIDDMAASRSILASNMVGPELLRKHESIRTQLEQSGAWTDTATTSDVSGNPTRTVIELYSLEAGNVDSGIVVVFRPADAGAADKPDRPDLRHAMDAFAARQREQEAIAALNKTALTGRFDDLVQAAAASAIDVVGVTGAMVYRSVEHVDELRIIAAYGDRDLVTNRLSVGRNSLAAFAVAAERTVVCTDTADETRFDTALMDKYSFKSGVAVPISGGGDDVWGAMVVYQNNPQQFSDRAIRFLGTVGEVLSASVKRTDLERELRYQTLHDPLTRLANRTLAYQRIDVSLARSRNESGMTVVMLVDLHDFRVVNDSFGHGAGDQLLAAVAAILTESVPMTDTVARFGGDEFLLVSSGMTTSFEAIALAQKIIARIRSPIDIGDRTVDISVCIGVAVGHGEVNAADMIRHADIALAGAKNEGPGNYELFDDAKGDIARRRLTVSGGLREALESDGLAMVYQPVYELATDRLVAVEALARWTSPVLGPVEPSEFIPSAERSGLIVPIGIWALRRACRDAANWGIDLRVNVSPLQLRHPDFAAVVDRILDETGCSSATLGIEITESIWVEDTETVKRNLAALHDLGVSIVLDDFGVGHSSLSYLTRFPVVDSVKIDRSFVAELPGAKAVAVLASLIALAQAFDLTVVGEGVETPEQLECLRASGCDMVQGFLLAEPMNADRIGDAISAGITRAR